MVLAVNQTEVYELPAGVQEENYSAQLDKIVTEVGFHKKGDRRVMLKKVVQLYSKVTGNLVRKDVWEWIYDTIESPPKKITHEVYADVYVPGIRDWGDDGLALIERTVTEQDAFGPYALWEHHLTSRTRTAGYIIYNQKPEDTGPSDEGKAELAKRGMTTTGKTGLSVRSGQPLINAIQENGIVDLPDGPQVAEWFDPYKTHSEFQIEQTTGIVSFSVDVDHYIPGSVRTSGPNFQQKPGKTWKFELALEPPQITAHPDPSNDRIVVKVKGGGTKIDPWSTGPRKIEPDGYRILRLENIKPDPPVTNNAMGIYHGTPPASTRGDLAIVTSSKDFSGVDSDPLPPGTMGNEPIDDPDPLNEPEPEYQELIMIAEVETKGSDEEVVVYDKDVRPGGEYYYIAISYIANSESPEARTPKVTHPSRTGSYMPVSTRIVGSDEDSTVEIDISPPYDAAFPDFDLGAALILDLPLDIGFDGIGSLEDFGQDFGQEVGRRIFNRDAEPKLRLDLELTSPIPLLTSDRGHTVEIESFTWETVANDRIITAETIKKKWMIEGFQLQLSASGSGLFSANSFVTVEEL